MTQSTMHVDSSDTHMPVPWAGEEDDARDRAGVQQEKMEERKAWLAGFVPGTYLDQSVDQISYSDFVNKACSPCAHAMLHSQCACSQHLRWQC